MLLRSVSMSWASSSFFKASTCSLWRCMLWWIGFSTCNSKSSGLSPAPHMMGAKDCSFYFPLSLTLEVANCRYICLKTTHLLNHNLNAFQACKWSLNTAPALRMSACYLWGRWKANCKQQMHVAGCLPQLPAEKYLKALSSCWNSFNGGYFELLLRTHLSHWVSFLLWHWASLKL